MRTLAPEHVCLPYSPLYHRNITQSRPKRPTSPYRQLLMPRDRRSWLPPPHIDTRHIIIDPNHVQVIQYITSPSQITSWTAHWPLLVTAPRDPCFVPTPRANLWSQLLRWTLDQRRPGQKRMRRRQDMRSAPVGPAGGMRNVHTSKAFHREDSLYHGSRLAVLTVK